MKAPHNPNHRPAEILAGMIVTSDLQLWSFDNELKLKREKLNKRERLNATLQDLEHKAQWHLNRLARWRGEDFLEWSECENRVIRICFGVPDEYESLITNKVAQKAAWFGVLLEQESGC